MGPTMNEAAAQLKEREFYAVDAVADCVAGALLRGARGNSGVILSLLFRGISHGDSRNGDSRREGIRGRDGGRR